MYNYLSSSINLINCTFSLNTAAYGGGVYNDVSSPTFTNSIFSSNSTYFNGEGGGIYNKQSSPNLINCTILLNSAASGGNGGGIYNYNSSSPTLNNCIVWGNVAVIGNQFYLDGGTTTLNYSCYGNGGNDVSVTAGGTFTFTNNNIITDPQFVNAGGGDLRIVGNSPCVDAGNDTYNSELNDIRSDGYPRKLNKLTGAVGTIDIGAYEYKFGADPLPVELTSFSALVVGTNVNLDWQTATELNNYGFGVERKIISNEQLTIDNWNKTGFVEGSGTSNRPKEYSFTDKNISTGKYSYRLKQIDRDGKFEYSQSVEVTVGQAPKEFALEQNYPNPFNPTTTIGFTLQVSGFTSLKVYDAIGREVVTLVNENLEAGIYHRQIFDASKLSSGIYLAKLQSGDNILLKKMLLIK
jgi:hypothetical protein